MKRLLLAALFALGLAAPAFGQTVIVASCPSATGVGGSAGSTGRPYAIDVNGNVCFIGSAALTGTSANNADAVASVATGLTPVAGYNFVYNGTTWDRLRGDTTSGAWVNIKNTTVPATLPTTGTIAAGNAVVPVPSAEAGAGVTPVVSAALESNKIIKAAAGNLYSAYVTTGAVAGWFLVANSTTAPTAGGAAIAPLVCVVAPINSTTSISYPDNAPLVASTGITLVFSSSGCLTNTASATVFFSGSAK